MNKQLFLLISLLTIILSSCKTKHDLTYFEDLVNSQAGELATFDYTYRLEPENTLIITVNSTVPEATAMFNMPYTNPASPGTTAATGSPLLQTYKIDNKGNIDFPMLGTIHVAGKTIYEVKELLQKRIDEYVKDAIVNVSMTGYKVTVLGEVNAPHSFFSTYDRLSILDALSECGDLTEYAKRDNILIMRRTDDGQIEYGRLDLRNSNITQSPYFWLKHNDVIIVEPNSIKQDNSKYNSNNAYKLSVISTITGISASIISLIIAFAIK